MATQQHLGNGSNEFVKAEKTKIRFWPDRWDPWYMDGSAGNDTLIGGPKNDTLHGGTGTDVLEGGKGNDEYRVDRFGDQIIEDAGEGFDTVRSSSSNYTLSNNLEKLVLEEYSHVIGGYGNNQNNDLFGNEYNNTLYGYGGKDVFLGNGGNDKIVGGTGDDVLQGGDGVDTLIGTNGSGDSSYNEKDFLLGGNHRDYFVLGSGNNQYYNSNGFNDYAKISDFDETMDIVQLPYDASSYGVGAVPSSVGGGAGLYHLNGSNQDLVAVFEGHSISSLDQTMDTFHFEYNV